METTFFTFRMFHFVMSPYEIRTIFLYLISIRDALKGVNGQIKSTYHTKEHMGLTTWADAPEGKIKKSDVNPAHVNINKVLSELDMDIFKLKNQFFIDAATYYIEHFGREALIEPKEKKEPQFISTEEMAVIEERIRQEAREEARQEANKEVMSMVGSMLAAMQANKDAISIIQQQADTDDNADSEDDFYDDVIAQSALNWMEKD